MVTVLVTVLLAAAALLWACGWWLVRVEPLPRGDAKAGDGGHDVAIIIPARNEAQNLPRLLRSLGRARANAVVADDGSTDRTAEVARAHGARVVTVPPAPGGFRGKTWACWWGAASTRASTLVFLDADTWLEPGGLDRLLRAHAREGGMLTVEPHHRVRRWHEQLSLLFNVVRIAAVGPRGGFGPCMVVSRRDYVRTHGHAHPAVRGQVLEHLALAGVHRELGLPVHARLGSGVLAMRMYPDSLGELVQGWSKGFASGARATPADARRLASAWISGQASLLTALLVAAAGAAPGWLLGAAAALSVAYGHQMRWLSQRAGSFSLAAAVLFPLPLLAFVAIHLHSVYLVRVRREVRWKGRRLLVAPTEEA